MKLLISLVTAFLLVYIRLLFVLSALILWGFISSLSQKPCELDNKVYQPFIDNKNSKLFIYHQIAIRTHSSQSLSVVQFVILLCYMCFLLSDCLFVISMLFKVVISSQTVTKTYIQEMQWSLLNISHY